jgi:hypothetical protein
MDIDSKTPWKPAFLIQPVDILSNQTQEFAAIIKLLEKHMGLT